MAARIIILPVVVCLVVGGSSLGAATFAPLTLPEIVRRAEVIFIGEVADVRPFTLVVRGTTVIKSRVIFRVATNKRVFVLGSINTNSESGEDDLLVRAYAMKSIR